MIKSNDKGYILITVLLLLLVLTIVGMSAINSSTVENMLSGNIRLRETNFSRADAGVELCSAVIERASRRNRGHAGMQWICCRNALPPASRTS